MKILIAGDWHSTLHEEPLARELRKLGTQVEEFRWHRYFRLQADSASPPSLASRFQNKYLFGPKIARLNQDLVRHARETRPDWLFLYRGTHVWPETLRKIKAAVPGLRIASYNNDNPFARRQSRQLWRHHLRGMPHCDLVLAYRPKNLDDYRRLTGAPVELFPPWFDPDVHHPQGDRTVDDLDFDCVFIGHYEDDGRIDCLSRLLKSKCRIGLFGDAAWNKPLTKLGITLPTPARPLWGREYTEVLNRSLTALCFFSRLNEDVYTRRCFEIPACGVALCSEYSEAIADLYAENEEAFFFRDADQLLDTINNLKKDPKRALAVGMNGRNAVIRQHGSICDRASQLIEMLGSPLASR